MDNLNQFPWFVRTWLGVKFPRAAFGVWAISGGEAFQVGTARPWIPRYGNDS